MVENVAALDAYREGKLTLPPGYELEYGADVLLLRRDGGSVVAAFSARGVSSSEVLRVATEDCRTHNRSCA